MGAGTGWPSVVIETVSGHWIENGPHTVVHQQNWTVSCDKCWIQPSMHHSNVTVTK